MAANSLLDRGYGKVPEAGAEPLEARDITPRVGTNGHGPHIKLEDFRKRS